MASVDVPLLGGAADGEGGRATRWIAAALRTVTAERTYQGINALVLAFLIVTNVCAILVVGDPNPGSACNLRNLNFLEQFVVIMPFWVLLATVATAVLACVGEVHWVTTVPIQVSIAIGLAGWTSVCALGTPARPTVNGTAIVLGFHVFAWVLWSRLGDWIKEKVAMLRGQPQDFNILG